MSRFLLSAAALLFSAAAASAQANPRGAAQPMPQGSAQYVITQNGKQVGSAQETVASIAGGYTLASSGDLRMDKFSYSFRNEQTVDAQANLVRDTLTGSVHGAKASGNDIRFDTSADSSGRKFNIRIDANGKQTSNTVERHRNCVLLPDLDPAAYVLMAHLALDPPPTAWILIPKQEGLLVPAEYEVLTDLHGTLNGQSIAVKHAAVAVSAQNSLVVELFYTGNGDLLEADLNAQGFRVAQPGFKLQDRPTPVPPPAGSAPQQNGQQPGAQQNGQQSGAQPQSY